MFKDIKIIAFDADDTLWQNEKLFRKAEQAYYGLLCAYMNKEELEKELFSNEIKNLPLYGYGIKSFVLSMLETALKVTNNKLPPDITAAIIELGREMLGEPIVLLDGVTEVLEKLSSKYTLIVATKGDLLDQERKIFKSGIVKYLHHIEVMSEKDAASYRKLLKNLNIEPRSFLMVGNSLKSDILPVLEIGANAIHIPHEDTWAHEVAAAPEGTDSFASVKEIRDIFKYI